MHDLRRSFATYAKNIGITHLTIKTLLNHSIKVDVTLGYIIEGIEQLRKSMQMITNYILHHADIKKSPVISLASTSTSNKTQEASEKVCE